MFSYNINFIISLVPEIFLFLSIMFLLTFSIIIVIVNKSYFENKELISNIKLLCFFILFIYIYLLFNVNFSSNYYKFLTQIDLIKITKILLSFLTMWILNQKIFFEKIKSFFFEISIFFLTCLLSFSLMISFDNLILIYIFIELQSLIFIILASLTKKLNSFAYAIQYFIISLIASCFLLLAISFIYGIFGTTNLYFISIIIELLISDYNFNWDFYTIFNLIIIAVLMKMGSFPIFNWLPKVYDGSFMFIASYFSIISFIAYFIFIFNFFINTVYLQINSIDIFFIACLGSVFFGSLGLLYQIKINRFMAYNSILNIGYVLAIILCIFTNNIINAYGVLNFITILYLISYCTININLWNILLHSSLGSVNKKSFINIQEFSILKFYNKPLWLLFIVSLCSMAGLPPFLGFIIKFFLICTVLKAGHILSCFFLVILTLFSIISYLIIIKIITFDNILNFDKTVYVSEYSFKFSNYIISLTSIIILIYFPFLDIVAYFIKY